MLRDAEGMSASDPVVENLLALKKQVQLFSDAVATIQELPAMLPFVSRLAAIVKEVSTRTSTVQTNMVDESVGAVKGLLGPVESWAMDADVSPVWKLVTCHSKSPLLNATLTCHSNLPP